MTKADKRKTLLATIKAKGAEREKALDAISDSLTDEEYKSEEDRIFDEYFAITNKLWSEYSALRFKAVRNDWMIKFVQSFGAGQHTISANQLKIFAKYGEYDNDMNAYGARVGSLLYTAKATRTGGHVTITEF